MLREYRLTNFKAFGETVTIPVRPLTLIFGANSSGKSSIFQSLLLLKQTLEESKNPETALLSKGSLVDLGSYPDFVHGHDTNLNFEVRARFDLRIPLALSRHERISEASLGVRFAYLGEARAAIFSRGNLYVGDKGQFIASYASGDRGDVGAAIEFARKLEFWDSWWNALYSCYADGDPYKHKDLAFLVSENSDDDDHRQNPNPLFQFEQEDWAKKDIETRKYIKEITTNAKMLENDMRNDLLDTFEELSYSCENFLPEDFSFQSRLHSIHSSNDTLLLEDWINLPVRRVCSSFRTDLENLVYLGPLRGQPEHYYEYSGDVSEYVGQRGEDLPSILFKKPDILEEINDDLKRLGVKYRLELSKLWHENKSPSDIFSLLLIDENTGVGASIRDVGFGISQVLPIVVQSRLSEKKTLLIEQPEIHLHPAHQAELGDLFIRSAKEQGNTLLLETHSENLILRILRRIRETTEGELRSDLPPIRPEDVAVLYVQPGEKGAQVIEIPVTEDGDFDRPWPQGFFEESIKELV